MPGVDGAVKLNNKVIAPISKTTETELPVSEFKLPQEEPSKEVEAVADEPIESETVKVNPVEVEPLEVYDLKKEFDKPIAVIKKAYEKVFSKSVGFKPEFGETIGDMILYLSAKLKAANANLAFDKAFGLVDYNISNKYLSNYIPLAIKLAVWCKQKGVLDICDELLYELSSVYVKCLKAVGVQAGEEDIEKAFSLEINEVFNK